tara:strand:+ start:322 stop:735 length:414 start_codon:yes stop_codon:yes gene_type:complete
MPKKSKKSLKGGNNTDSNCYSKIVPQKPQPPTYNSNHELNDGATYADELSAINDWFNKIDQVRGANIGCRCTKDSHCKSGNCNKKGTNLLYRTGICEDKAKSTLRTLSSSIARTIMKSHRTHGRKKKKKSKKGKKKK